MDLPLQLISLLVLLFLSAFFSSTETAFFSLSRLQLGKMKQEKSSKAKLVVSQLQHPRRLLSSVLVGNTLVNVLAASLATSMLIALLGDKGVWISTLLMTLLVLALGEIAPKSIAVHNPEKLAKRAALSLYLFSMAIFPVREALRALTSLIYPEEEKVARLTEDELKTMITLGHSNGAVAGFEKETITNILELEQTAVKEIMTPRGEVFSLAENIPLWEACQLVKERRYSRVPVYRDSTENIVGIVYAKDLLACQGQKQKGTLPIRKADFVPETKRLSLLLTEFQGRKKHLFVVVDEYGALAGVVTLDDLLEEVVGRVINQPTPKERYEFTDRYTIKVSARMEIERFNQLLGTAIDAEDVETVGGFVISKTGRIPQKGESFCIDQLQVKVIEAQRNRIVELEIKKVHE